MKTCFLIGHRDAPGGLRERLVSAIGEAIMRDGVTEFVVGQYGAFDRMAAGCLAEAKKAHPELRLVLLLPYHPAERPVYLPRGFDGSFYPPGMERVPRRLAIVRANESTTRLVSDKGKLFRRPSPVFARKMHRNSVHIFCEYSG